MARSLRVAVADDEPVMRMYLADVVAHIGHEVVAAASDGVELVEMCREQRPDLIITDVRMPGMDGLQAVQQVLKEAPMPVIVVTGHDGVDVAVPAVRDCGASVYLTKPIDEEALREAIDAALERFSQFQEFLRDGEGADADMARALESWQWVVEGKATLMGWLKVSDAHAFEALKKLAHTRRISLREAARQVITLTNP